MLWPVWFPDPTKLVQCEGKDYAPWEQRSHKLRPEVQSYHVVLIYKVHRKKNNRGYIGVIFYFDHLIFEPLHDKTCNRVELTSTHPDEAF